jgi:hypothetical protein
MATASQSLFLMNPANEPFIRKKTTHPDFKDSSNLEIGVVAALFVIVLILFLALGGPAWKSYLDLTNNGVVTQGQVAAIRFEERDVDYFYVRYSFAAGGQAYEREQRVHLDQFEMLVDNHQDLPVQYVANNPTVSRLAAPYEEFADFRVPGTIAAIIFLVMVGGSLFVSVDRRMQHADLASKGKLVKGSVVSAYGNQPGKDGGFLQILTLLLSPAYYRMRQRNQSQFTVKVRYQFTSPVSGKVLTRTETAVRNDLDRRGVPDSGATVAVLYCSDHLFKLM